MDNGVAVYLPKELAAEVDRVRVREFRSRNNFVQVSVVEPLERREPAVEPDTAS